MRVEMTPEAQQEFSEKMTGTLKGWRMIAAGEVRLMIVLDGEKDASGWHPEDWQPIVPRTRKKGKL